MTAVITVTRTGYTNYELHERDNSTNTHVQIDRSIDLCVLQDACYELFCVFKDFYASETQDIEVTKSLLFFHCCRRKLSEKQEKLQANNLELNGSNARLKSQVGSY